MNTLTKFPSSCNFSARNNIFGSHGKKDKNRHSKYVIFKSILESSFCFFCHDLHKCFSGAKFYEHWEHFWKFATKKIQIFLLFFLFFPELLFILSSNELGSRSWLSGECWFGSLLQGAVALYRVPLLLLLLSKQPWVLCSIKPRSLIGKSGAVWYLFKNIIFQLLKHKTIRSSRNNKEVWCF